MLNRGFTLIEVLLVIGLVGVVGGLVAITGVDTFRRASIQTERSQFVSAVYKARSESMNNICHGTCTTGKAHGVRIFSDRYVVYQGDSYITRDADFDEVVIPSYPVQFVGPSDTLQFKQLSGDAVITPSGTHEVTLKGVGDDSAVVHVSEDGRITWN